MEDGKQDWTYWSGWIAFYSLTALLFIFVTVRSDWAYSLICRPNENHCLREWISATGGWAALLAAVPTIHFLRKQITDSDRHHKEALKYQFRSLRNIALEAFGAADEARGNAWAIARAWDPGKNTFDPREQEEGEILREVAFLRQQYEDPIFKLFEREIDVPPNMKVEQIVERFDALADTIREMGRPIWLSSDLRLIAGEVARTCGLAMSYSDVCKEYAERFLVEFG